MTLTLNTHISSLTFRSEAAIDSVPKSLHKNLVKNDLMVSEKSKFQFSHILVTDLEPRSRNDLDLQYSHAFIFSISCLHLPAFSSQAVIVSEKSIVFTFSYRKA